MYNIIYRLKNNEGGTGLVPINMEKTYPGLFRAFNISSQNIPTGDRIWHVQNPYLYRTEICSRINDYVFVRDKFVSFFPGKKLTNGFSYLKSHPGMYRYFLPNVYQSNFGISDEPAIGYYVRDCRIQSNNEFIRFAQRLPPKTKVVTMGTKELICEKIPSNVEWFHTYDQHLFWKSCSHFFYYRCSDIQDPLPHTVLEAIQSKHRIISPIDKNRDFKDGIDDLLSCVEFDESFYPDRIGDYCCHLNTKNWQDFMYNIASDGFRINFPINRATYREWLEEIL